jgi:hypothetical protein
LGVGGVAMRSLALLKLLPLKERTTSNPQVKIGLIDGPIVTQHPDLAGERFHEFAEGRRRSILTSEQRGLSARDFRSGNPVCEAEFSRSRRLPRLLTHTARFTETLSGPTPLEDGRRSRNFNASGLNIMEPIELTAQNTKTA